MPARRFPPPWSIEESSACFIVRDGDKQALAYVYFENEKITPYHIFDGTLRCASQQTWLLKCRDGSTTSIWML